MLTEDQIQRYSRQILLKEVGGRGQQRLLATAVEVEGASRVLDVAVAYLAASGTPLVDRTPRRDGFLQGATLQTFAPDSALPPGAPVGWLGPLDVAPASHARFRVAVSASGLIAAPAGAPLPGVRLPAEADADPVALGALAALTVQRYALGLEPSSLVLSQVEGRWQRLA